MSRTSADILADAARTLATAQHGLALLESGNPSSFLPGLHNVAVFGRAVTNILQNLRSTEPAFDDWYAPYVTEMQSDPLLRRFYKLRTEILKVGTPSTASSVFISNLSLPQDLGRLGPAPRGATTFFVGDQHGGTGWEIPQPDGSIEKYYVELPPDIGHASVQLADAPAEHLGDDVSNRDVPETARMYVDYLAGMVAAARAQFLR